MPRMMMATLRVFGGLVCAMMMLTVIVLTVIVLTVVMIVLVRGHAQP
jgi:heme/copper-type cytochrome/quinol oxidase subunit 2